MDGLQNSQDFSWNEVAGVFEFSGLNFSATRLFLLALACLLIVVIFITSCSLELEKGLVPMDIQYAASSRFPLRPNQDD